MTPATAPLAPTRGDGIVGAAQAGTSAASTHRQQVEHEEAAVPHPVLDVVAEDPEREQVADERAASPPCRKSDVSADVQENSAGTSPCVEEESIEVRRRTERRRQEGHEVRGDEGDRHPRRGARRNDVADAGSCRVEFCYHRGS